MSTLKGPQDTTKGGGVKEKEIGKKRLETVCSRVPLKTYSWPHPSKAKLWNCRHTERPPVSCDETSESHIMAVWDCSLKWAVVVPSSRYYGLRLQTTLIFERQIHQTFWEAYIDARVFTRRRYQTLPTYSLQMYRNNSTYTCRALAMHTYGPSLDCVRWCGASYPAVPACVSLLHHQHLPAPQISGDGWSNRFCFELMTSRALRFLDRLRWHNMGLDATSSGGRKIPVLSKDRHVPALHGVRSSGNLEIWLRGRLYFYNL